MTEPWQAGGFCRAVAGFAECGDAFVIEPRPGGALLVAIVDGLGHGHEAGVAALAAVRVIAERIELPVADIMRHCDAALRPTRGAAVGVLKLEPDGRGEFCGIGNVEVQSLDGQPPGVFCLAGIVGHNMRTVRAMPFTMLPGDVYCLHSDGVSSRANLRECLPGTPAGVARRIVDAWGRHHDDATAVILGFRAAARLSPSADSGGKAPPPS